MQPKLTRREKEIFTHLLDGLVPKEIAGKLKISYDTVVTHQKKLYRKLDVHSIEELLEKYGNKNEDTLPPVTAKKPSFSKNLTKPKVIIPAAIAVMLAAVFFAGARFIITKQSAEIPIEPKRVYLTDGTYLTSYEIDKVHLRANRWVNEEDVFYGETYHANRQILFSEIYNGDFDKPFPNTNHFKLKLSGTIDKECKNFNVDISYQYEGRWINTVFGSLDKRVSIGPGPFSEVLEFRRHNYKEFFPEGGYVIFDAQNSLLVVNNGWIDDTGERIPDDMPNGAIWATISNLKIEPVY